MNPVPKHSIQHIDLQLAPGNAGVHEGVVGRTATGQDALKQFVPTRVVERGLVDEKIVPIQPDVGIESSYWEQRVPINAADRLESVEIAEWNLSRGNWVEKLMKI